MVSTFTVVAASLLLGQAPDAPPAGAQAAPKTYTYSGGVLVPVGDAQKPALLGRDAPDNSRPILSKIRSWFKTGADAPTHTFGGNDSPKAIFKPLSPIAPAVETPATPPAELPRKLPISQAFTPNSEVRVIQQQTATDKPKIVETKTESPKVEMPKADAPKTEAVSNVSLKAAPNAATPILPINANRIGRDEKFEWVTGQLEIEKGRFVLYYATPETVDTHHGRIQLNPQKIDMTQFRTGDLVSVRGQLRVGANPVYQLTDANLIERPKR
jgi:hypothetical protein